jgi:hypothetical protein
MSRRFAFYPAPPVVAAAGGGTINLTISSSVNDYNLFTAAGSPAGVVTVNLTIQSPAIVGSTSTSTPGLTTGAGWAGGSAITITVNSGARIQGKGGNGGHGESYLVKSVQNYGQGGGGGAGSQPGSKGIGGDNNSNGNDGTTEAGGASGTSNNIGGVTQDPTAGSLGGNALNLTIATTVVNNGTIYGGGGGGAGAPADATLNWASNGGAFGSQGAPTTNPYKPAAIGGVGGNAVKLNGNSITWNPQGTTAGAIS